MKSRQWKRSCSGEWLSAVPESFAPFPSEADRVLETAASGTPVAPPCHLELSRGTVHDRKRDPALCYLLTTPTRSAYVMT